MSNILVTAIGSFSADVVIRCLKNNNHKVIGCDIYKREWVANSVIVDKFYQAPYATNSLEYINFIKKICVEESINYIMPLTDVEVDVYNENRKWFEENKIVVCFSSKETINICRNKKLLEEKLSIAKDVNVIPTYYANDEKIYNLDFPLVFKPYNGRSSQGLEYVKNNEELKKILKKENITDFVVQPFIEGIIVTVDILRNVDGSKVVCISRKELLRTSNGAGLSVYVYKDERLNDICVKIANALDIKGCVNFEFILDNNGEYHFIECNPRFSGGTAFSVSAGYNIVENHLKVFQDKEIETFEIKNNMHIVKKYTEIITSVE